MTSKKFEGASLPGWPRGLSEDLAAAYVGLSPGSFQRMVDGKDEKGQPLPPAKTAPQPVRFPGRRKVWLRDQLDAWLDQLAGRAPSLGETELWPTDGEDHAALPQPL